MPDDLVDNKEDEEGEKNDWQIFKPMSYHLIPQPTPQPSLEALKRIENTIEELGNRVLSLEKKIDDSIPGKILTEDRFLHEIESTDDLVDRIVTKFNSLLNGSSAQEILQKINEGSFGKSEAKKIELIADLLKTNKKLSSLQLAKLINISRTRANEYLRMMEKLGIAKGVLIGKEKYYQMKNIL